MRLLLSTLLIILFISLALLNSCSKNEQAQQETDNFSFTIDTVLYKDSLNQIAQKYGLIGMSVVVLVKGKIAYSFNTGYGKSDSSQILNEKTQFRIASISKLVTSIAAMKLWQDEKLDLDEDVSTYLGWTLRNPSFPDKKITMRHLLNHLSGIRDGSGYGNFSAEMIAKQLDIRNLFQQNGSYFTPNMFANTEPGTYFSYSNAAYGLVATVIEKVSGQRFDVFTKESIFEPMELSSSFNVATVDISNLATLYRFKNGSWVAQADDYSSTQVPINAFAGYQIGQNGLLFGPQGSLRASTLDLAEIGLVLLKKQTGAKQVLLPSTIDTMLNSSWTYSGNNGDTWGDFWLKYGLGVHHITNQAKKDIIFPDRSMVGHPGIAYGLLSDLYVDPRNKSGIVFITNGSKYNYNYATTSTFYQVEADLFELIHPLIIELESN